MKILFDHQAFMLQRYGGVSRCFIELVSHLPKNVDAKISLLESQNVYALNSHFCKPIGYYFQHFPIHRWNMFDRWYRLRGKDSSEYWDTLKYNYIRTIKELKKGSFDIFHPTYYDDYFLSYLKGKPFVLTIHDMIPELYPQFFSKDDFQIRMKCKLAPLASAIVAVSETTKRDIIRILGVSEKKVHVVYHGCSFPEVRNVSAPYQFPYILYVGARRNYKNFTPFVRSIVPLLEKYKDLYVVCTGNPFDDKEKAFLDGLKVRNRFVQRWIKDDEELYSLYHYAVCFVYPSDYEGFGIPILEAYKADCPVVLNRTSCFPEIAQDAAVYFEMNSGDSDLSEQLERMLLMTEEDKTTLLSKQRIRLKAFSWERSAKKLVSVYESIL